MAEPHELQREGIVTQDERGIGFTDATFAYFERWKTEYNRYRWRECTALNGILLQPPRDGRPMLLNLEAHDLWTT